MFKRVYVEIQNICNLHCSFCPKTRRAPGQMKEEEFRRILDQLQGHTRYLCFHVMGEPLLHPELGRFLALAGEKGYRVCLTTNGTKLKEKAEVLLASDSLHKVSISLHAMEGNGRGSELEEYLSQVRETAAQLSARGVICSFRLWNIGGEDRWNGQILRALKDGSAIWEQQPNGSIRLGERLYLEEAEKFDWPDLTAEEQETRFCYGLRQQIAVLCDGTVVPCCLDHEGDIPLGNLLEEPLETIVNSPRARALYEGFTNRKPSEELCRHCGYATRFGH